MNREEYDDIYRWSLRPKFWDWNAREGYQKPVFGRMVIPNSVAFYLGIISIRFRFWGSAPKKVFFHYHPPIFKWYPYFDVDIRS